MTHHPATDFQKALFFCAHVTNNSLLSLSFLDSCRTLTRRAHKVTINMYSAPYQISNNTNSMGGKKKEKKLP